MGRMKDLTIMADEGQVNAYTVFLNYTLKGGTHVPLAHITVYAENVDHARRLATLSLRHRAHNEQWKQFAILRTKLVRRDVNVYSELA